VARPKGILAEPLDTSGPLGRARFVLRQIWSAAGTYERFCHQSAAEIRPRLDLTGGR
jgi:hypothetical protein